MSVSLHTHSWYSLLEGVSSPEALLTRAIAGEYTALALTDTNNLYGAVSFAAQAHHHGIRPFIGATLDHGGNRCVALIAEPAGYRSLCRIISRINLAQRPDLPPAPIPPLAELLETNAEGLHVLATDPGLAESLREVLGTRLWLEIVRPGDPKREADLHEAGRRLGVPIVASTAAHAATPEEYPTLRLVHAIRRRGLIDQVPAELAIGPAHHLTTVNELRERFHDLPEALHNAEKLAEVLRSDVLPWQVILPRPRLRSGINEKDFLERLCEKGLRGRGLGANLDARDRMRDELAIINGAGLDGYFLTVRDIARHARRKRHSMALRGSAGNSLVCYLLGITDVDPLRFGLSLERFLHTGRSDLPDIDLDFDWKVRDAVIDHVFRRYGAAHVARISSHLFFQPASAFREAARVHGLADEQTSTLLGHLAERVEELVASPESSRTVPRTFPLEPERWPRLLDDAQRLLGRPHHLSLHPGGIVMTPGPIEDHAPLEWAAKGVVMTQFDKDGVEAVGLVKIDLLGNRALATVDEACAWIAAENKPKPANPTGNGWSPSAAFRVPHALLTIADDDPATADLVRRGDTVGVNQLESPAMRHLLVQLGPRCVDDVILSLALIRPGAAGVGMKECYVRRRQGLDSPSWADPHLADLLRDTLGLLIFEDDVLRVLQALTGLSAAQADRFRKRVGKHRAETESRALANEFYVLCARGGLPPAAAAELWPQIVKFNRYSFCKSHAVSYGLIAWKAAYLKAHHPLAFWPAALNNNQGCYPQRVYVEAAKRGGISFRPPCVNRSLAAFSVEEGALRVGLEVIAGLPEEVRESTLAARQQDGPFRDLADFRRRVGPGREALALLIRAGALDWTDRPRPALFLDAELQDLRKSGDGDLFTGPSDEGWAPADYAPLRRLTDEWLLLGFVTGPPLLSLLRRPWAKDRRAPLITATQVPAHVGRRVCVEGLVATARHMLMDDGRAMQFITLEDATGLSEVTLFPGTCPPVPHLRLGPYLATGIIEEQYGVCTLTAERLDYGPADSA